MLPLHVFSDAPGHPSRGDESSRDEVEHLPPNQSRGPRPAEQGPRLHAPRHALDSRRMHIAECRDLAEARRAGGGMCEASKEMRKKGSNPMVGVQHAAEFSEFLA